MMILSPCLLTVSVVVAVNCDESLVCLSTLIVNVLTIYHPDGYIMPTVSLFQ